MDPRSGWALAVSASVAICTVIVSALVAVPVAIVAAARKRRVSDYLIRARPWPPCPRPPRSSPGPHPDRGGAHRPAPGLRLGLRHRSSDVPYLVLPVATLTVYLSPILVRVVRERAIVIFAWSRTVEAAVARGVPRRSVVVR